jgi:hypothetical protein
MNTQKDIERTCDLCGTDRTPLSGGIYPINDRRGDCLGLFGDCCASSVLDAVLKTPKAYREASREEIKSMVFQMAAK